MSLDMLFYFVFMIVPAAILLCYIVPERKPPSFTAIRDLINCHQKIIRI